MSSFAIANNDRVGFALRDIPGNPR